MKCNQNIKQLLFVSVYMMLIHISVFAQVERLNPAVQAVLFSKIFDYIITVEKQEAIEISVVYDQNVSDVEAIKQAFNNENLKAEMIPLDQLPGKIEHSSILYLSEGLDEDLLKKYLKNSEALTITGDPALVEEGLVSIGVGSVEQQFKIFLNVGQLTRERHEASLDLLNLATIIQN